MSLKLMRLETICRRLRGILEKVQGQHFSGVITGEVAIIRSRKNVGTQGTFMVTGVSQRTSRRDSNKPQAQNTRRTRCSAYACRQGPSAVVLNAVGDLAEGEDRPRRPTYLEEESGASVEKMYSQMSAGRVRSRKSTKTVPGKPRKLHKRAAKEPVTCQRANQRNDRTARTRHRTLGAQHLETEKSTTAHNMWCVCCDKCRHRSQCVHTQVCAQGVRRACAAYARCAALCFASLRVACYSFHFISFHFISFHFISFHFISFHFISFHFISFHFISFHFISFHFISFHFISFHFISFHKCVSSVATGERARAGARACGSVRVRVWWRVFNVQTLALPGPTQCTCFSAEI